MKKSFLILCCIFFIKNFAQAQSAINVTITGECAPTSATYLYNGLVNGKNNYAVTLIIDSVSTVFAVGFDGIKWVLYIDGDITDDGFSNIAVPAGLLPPFTGWVATQCNTGTMVISQVVAVNDANNFEKNVMIYPTPSANYIIIENTKDANNIFEYKILDLVGKTITSENSMYNTKIMIENLVSGSYIIQINDTNGRIANKKLVKI
jgi:hypothetical protein